MKVNEALILKLEKLSKLQLGKEERLKITSDLESILGMVEKLETLDTEGVEPLVYMSNEVNRLREDVISGQVDNSDALKNAPKKSEAYFLVPKVVKK